MSFPERPCDTFRRTKIKDCNDIKALASDGGKCFLKFIKKYLHNYTPTVYNMQVFFLRLFFVFCFYFYSFVCWRLFFRIFTSEITF